MTELRGVRLGGGDPRRLVFIWVHINDVIVILNLGPISPTCLWAAFLYKDPKRAKRHWWLDSLFTFLGFSLIKAACKHVGEIDPCSQRRDGCAKERKMKKLTILFLFSKVVNVPHSSLFPNFLFESRTKKLQNFPQRTIKFLDGTF